MPISQRVHRITGIKGGRLVTEYLIHVIQWRSRRGDVIFLNASGMSYPTEKEKRKRKRNGETRQKKKEKERKESNTKEMCQRMCQQPSKHASAAVVHKL